MMNNNKITWGPCMYLYLSFAFKFICLTLYYLFLFVHLPGFSPLQSKFLFFSWFLIVFLLSLILTIKNRTTTNIAVNVLFPLEVYALVSYYRFIPNAVSVSVIVTVVIVLAFILIALSPDKKSRNNNTKLNIKRFIKPVLMNARTVITFCLLLFLIPLGVKQIVGGGLFKPDIPAISDTSINSEWTVEKQIDSVKLLQQEEWKHLTIQEKLDVLGVVTNIETRYLGINHPLNLKADVLDGDILASYSESSYTILIDMSLLEFGEAENVLESLLHECFHAYQHQLVTLYNCLPVDYQNMLLFQYVDDYTNEFDNYIDEKGDAYFNQMVEITARSHAREGVSNYYYLINYYLGGN